MKKLFNLTLLVSLLFAGSLQAQFNAYKTILSKVSDSTATTPSGYGAIRYNTQGGKNKWQFDNGAGFVDFGSGSSSLTLVDGNGTTVNGTGDGVDLGGTVNSSVFLNYTGSSWMLYATATDGDFEGTMNLSASSGGFTNYNAVTGGSAGFSFLNDGANFYAQMSTRSDGLDGQILKVGLNTVDIFSSGTDYIGGSLRLQSSGSLSSGRFAKIQMPVLAASYTLTMPVDAGTSGYILSTDGSGVLSWAAPSGGGIGGSTGATDNSILRADGTGGATLQNSAVSIQDDGDIDIGTDAGSSRTIAATGTDPNIALSLKPKGNQNVGIDFGTSNAFAIQQTPAFRLFAIKGDASASTDFSITAAAGIAGVPNGQHLRILAGNGSGTADNDGGNVYLTPGTKTGTGTPGALILGSSTSLLTFFDGTPVVKQSAASDLQTFYNGMVAYGMFPAATLSGGGGSGLTYAQVKAMKFK